MRTLYSLLRPVPRRELIRIIIIGRKKDRRKAKVHNKAVFKHISQDQQRLSFRVKKPRFRRLLMETQCAGLVSESPVAVVPLCDNLSCGLSETVFVTYVEVPDRALWLPEFRISLSSIIHHC